jgi:hypothetical protein
MKILASEAELLRESLEVDRTMLLAEMAYICLRYGTGRWQQGTEKVVGRR